MADDELLRVEFRRLAERLDSLLDDNRRAFTFIERLARGVQGGAADMRLLAQAIRQSGDRAGSLEITVNAIVKRLEQGEQLGAVKARAEQLEAEVVSAKLDKLHKDITGQFPVTEIRESVSKPPPGYAGYLREFRKSPRFTQLLLALLVFLLGGLYIEERVHPRVEPEHHGHIAAP